MDTTYTHSPAFHKGEPTVRNMKLGMHITQQNRPLTVRGPSSVMAVCVLRWAAFRLGVVGCAEWYLAQHSLNHGIRTLPIFLRRNDHVVRPRYW